MESWCLKGTVFPFCEMKRVHWMTDASGGGSHLSKSKSNCQELAGPWQGASHPSASLYPEAGREAPHSRRSSALHALSVGSWGASAPLGGERKGKLSHVLGGCCGEGRREWPTAESGGTWLPKWNSPPRAHFWRQQGRLHPTSGRVSAPFQLCMQMPDV